MFTLGLAVGIFAGILITIVLFYAALFVRGLYWKTVDKIGIWRLQIWRLRSLWNVVISGEFDQTIALAKVESAMVKHRFDWYRDRVYRA